LKVRFKGLTVMVGDVAAVTVSVTGTFFGLLEAPEDVTVTFPV
jgi:hypothetical protein